MGRHAKPYIIDAAEAAKHLDVKLDVFYRYCRNGQIEGEIEGKRLAFDRRKLTLIPHPLGRPRIHEPESGRTQVTHSPEQLKSWLKQAKSDDFDSLASWLRWLGNKRAGITS